MEEKINTQTKEQVEIQKLRHIIVKLIRKITSSNKRIDDILRTQKKVQEGLATVEHIVYTSLVESDEKYDGKEDNDTPIEKGVIETCNYDTVKHINNTKTCMCCMYKTFKYDDSDNSLNGVGYIQCDCSTSPFFGRRCEYNFKCSEHITGYRTTISPDIRSPYPTIKKQIKKIFAYDFINNETIEEEVGE